MAMPASPFARHAGGRRDSRVTNAHGHSNPASKPGPREGGVDAACGRTFEDQPNRKVLLSTHYARWRAPLLRRWWSAMPLTQGHAIYQV